MKSLTEAGKETQRKESRNQFNDHSSPLPTGALRVRETDAQRARESDREAPTDRHTRAHALTHMHAHRHGRNVRTQANSEEAERQARGKPPSPASLWGCSHPAPPSPAHHHEGPAGHLHHSALSAWPCWPRRWPKLPVPPGGSDYKQSCYMCKLLGYI